MQRKALPWLRLPSSEGRAGFLPAVLQTRNRADYQRQYYCIYSTVRYTVQNRYLVPNGYQYRTPNFYCRPQPRPAPPHNDGPANKTQLLPQDAPGLALFFDPQ